MQDQSQVVEHVEESYSLLKDKMIEWVDGLVLMLPNFVAAIVVVLIFFVLAKLIRELTLKVIHRFSHNPELDRLISSVTFIIIFLIGIFVALGILKLEKTVTSLLAGAGIIGLALGFAFQDVAANFMAGILIMVRKPFYIGDIIETNDYFGTVERINFRTTIIRTPQGQVVYMPNKKTFENALINFTKLGKRRIDLKIGISYGDDLEKVKKITLEAVQKINYLLEDREVEFFYEEFDDYSIKFIVRFWIFYSKQPDYLKAISDAIMNIKTAYNENNITIPFPIRTLDFAIKRGQKLSEMLPDDQNE